MSEPTLTRETKTTIGSAIGVVAVLLVVALGGDRRLSAMEYRLQRIEESDRDRWTLSDMRFWVSQADKKLGLVVPPERKPQ